VVVSFQSKKHRFENRERKTERKTESHLSAYSYNGERSEEDFTLYALKISISPASTVLTDLTTFRHSNDVGFILKSDDNRLRQMFEKAASLMTDVAAFA
jgi:hypothetical protein